MRKRRRVGGVLSMPYDTSLIERACSSSQRLEFIGQTERKRFVDGENHAVCVRQHVVVPESENSIASCFQPSRARQILDFVDGVLPTIDFDDERRLWAKEIHHVTPNRLLASKPKAADLLSTYSGPQANFRFGRIAAQSSRDRGCHCSIVTSER